MDLENNSSNDKILKLIQWTAIRSVETEEFESSDRFKTEQQTELIVSLKKLFHGPTSEITRSKTLVTISFKS